MTLVQLKHFLELAHCNSFSQAAQHLHLTQPALSRSIRALEDEFGHRLFDRAGRSVMLTAFGEQLLPNARLLVDKANELSLIAPRIKKGELGHVRIGLGSGPGAMLMTPLLMLMATDYPQSHIDISRGSTPLLVQALRDRTLDALVLDIRSLTPSSDLNVEMLQEMRGAFMCRVGHPLGRLRQIDFKTLRNYPIASTPLSDEVARILIARFGKDAHPDHLINLRCEEISSLLEVARNSDAIVLAIRQAAPDLLELPVTPKLNAKARFGLVTMASRSEHPFLETLRDMMRDIMKD